MLSDCCQLPCQKMNHTSSCCLDIELVGIVQRLFEGMVQKPQILNTCSGDWTFVVHLLKWRSASWTLANMASIMEDKVA